MDFSAGVHDVICTRKLNIDRGLRQFKHGAAFDSDILDINEQFKLRVRKTRALNHKTQPSGF